MIGRRVVLGAIAAACAGPAHAQAAPIQAFAQALVAAMKAGRATPFATRAAALKPAVVGALDMDVILRATVGVKWGAIAPDMQANLLAAFIDFTVASWVANFDAFAGERIEVAGETRKVGSDEVVTMRIVPTQGDATRLDFVMRTGASGWKAVDILVDGSISRVAVQRSDFRQILTKGEAALLELLRGKTADLAAGAK